MWLEEMGYVKHPTKKFYSSLPDRKILVYINNLIDGSSVEEVTYIGFYSTSWDSVYAFSQEDEDGETFVWTCREDDKWTSVETSKTKYMTRAQIRINE